jgi:glycosyltransferase involved in cell wall biosynthesis
MSQPPRSLTIIVPAYNEAARLETTIAAVLKAAAASLDRYEIVIVDDGSTDATFAVATGLAALHPEITVLRHEVNQGVGAAYCTALNVARHPFLTLVPGDNAFEPACLPAFFSALGKAEIIISYRENPSARTLIRRTLSIICTSLLRLATGVPLRDGHSLYIWPVEKARRIRVPADYRYHLTTLCALLPQVSTYAEIPVRLTPKPDMFSRVLRPRVVLGLGVMMLRILARNRLGLRFRPPRAVKLGGTAEDPARPAPDGLLAAD